MISVVLYVHNGEKYLEEALASILAQTHADFDLFVLDDGSTDATPDILAGVADARFRWERQEARGRERLHETFNRCLEATSGDLVAIANADDVWRPEKLERQLACFEADPALDVCFHEAYFIDARGRHTLLSFRPVPSPNPVTDIRGRHFFRGDPIANPTVMFRRSILRVIGVQETGWVHDYQFWMKAALAGCRFLGLPDRLISYRVHEGSHSTSSAHRDRLREENRAMLRSMAERCPLHHLYPELAGCRDGAASLAFAHFDLALLLMQAELADLARAHLEQVLAVRPEHPEALNNLGVLALVRAAPGVARSLLGRAAAGGSSVAEHNLHLVSGTPPPGGWMVAPWEGAEPELAAAVKEPFAPGPRAEVPVAGSLLVLGSDADRAALPALFDAVLEGHGPAQPLVVLTEHRSTTEAVVEAFTAAESRHGTGAEADVHLLESACGELESVVRAHRMDRPEVVPASGGPRTRRLVELAGARAPLPVGG